MWKDMNIEQIRENNKKTCPGQFFHKTFLTMRDALHEEAELSSDEVVLLSYVFNFVMRNFTNFYCGCLSCVACYKQLKEFDGQEGKLKGVDI